jgi:hypothetical protein
MPVYPFYCPAPEKHITERYAPMSKIPKWIKCEECGKRAKLGIAPTLGFIRNAVMGQKTKDGLRWAFGKEKAARIRTSKDVDACLTSVAKRYKHLMPGYDRKKTYDLNSAHDLKELGTPSYKLSDPFPEQQISDSRENHGERSER